MSELITLPNSNGSKESASDAFGRLRVSNPSYVFDAQMTYDLQPLLFEQVTAQTGATIAHSADNRNAVMTFASTPSGGQAYMQSFQHNRYQPGRSQRAFITFNFQEATANCLKFAGLSTGTNGIEVRHNGTTWQVAILSGSDEGDQVVDQADWNLDPLDGSNNSETGAILDISKHQILVIEFQALYVGRVKIGFDIGGKLTFVHDFENANIKAQPYIQTANLPVRAGMTCTGTVSTAMNFTCCSVISEGGEPDVEGFDFSFSGSVTAASGARTHAVSLRPKTLFNSIDNRAKFVFENIEVLAGNAPVKWEIVLGQAISGTTTFTDVNTTYALIEYNTAGTLSGNPAIVIASGFVGTGAGSRVSASADIKLRYPITLDAAGNPRILGTFTLLLTGIGGTSACQYAVNWHGIR